MQVSQDALAGRVAIVGQRENVLPTGVRGVSRCLLRCRTTVGADLLAAPFDVADGEGVDGTVKLVRGQCDRYASLSLLR